MSNKNNPLTKFHFQVKLGDVEMNFSEVSGLSFETGIIEYRDGSSPEYHVKKIPGLTKYSNVTLKRGVMLGDIHLYKLWKNTYFFGSPANYQIDVTITLLNEEHKPVLVWQLNNAWPCKMVYGDLNAAANEILIESIELVHEGLSIVT